MTKKVSTDIEKNIRIFAAIEGIARLDAAARERDLTVEEIEERDARKRTLTGYNAQARRFVKRNPAVALEDAPEWVQRALAYWNGTPQPNISPESVYVPPPIPEPESPPDPRELLPDVPADGPIIPSAPPAPSGLNLPETATDGKRVVPPGDAEAQYDEVKNLRATHNIELFLDAQKRFGKGRHPVLEMLNIGYDEEMPPAARVNALKEAAQYFNPKLKQVEINKNVTKRTGVMVVAGRVDPNTWSKMVSEHLGVIQEASKALNNQMEGKEELSVLPEPKMGAEVIPIERDDFKPQPSAIDAVPVVFSDSPMSDGPHGPVKK
jgi:hypothetical protein